MKKSDAKTFSFYIGKVFSTLLDFILPQFCLGCRKEGSLCCPQCLASLELLPLDPLPWADNHFTFSACYICLDYKNKLVQRLIKAFKYQYLEHISDLLANFLYHQALKLNLPSNTLICNIPLHKSKRKQRGFDQTELLAKKLALKLNLEYSPLLSRIKKTKTQAQLSKEDRQKNMKDVFVLNKEINYHPILLIDDIATTGSTLNEASKLFKTKVICLVIAKN